MPLVLLTALEVDTHTYRYLHRNNFKKPGTPWFKYFKPTYKGLLENKSTTKSIGVW